MLCRRWWWAHRNRHAGGGYKSLQGTVVKSHGIERWRKGSNSCQISIREMNEHVNLLRTCRKRRDSIKTGGLSLIREEYSGDLFTGYTVGCTEKA